MEAEILDLPVQDGHRQEAGLDYLQSLLLGHELVHWIGDDQIIGPQTARPFESLWRKAWASSTLSRRISSSVRLSCCVR
jgi:hypothetical protein